jgi:hypothetical protein
MELHILKSQANLVFEIITRLELDPSNFWWEETDGWYSKKPASQFNYKGSDHYFQFDNSHNFCSEFCPGVENVTEHDTSRTGLSNTDLFSVGCRV